MLFKFKKQKLVVNAFVSEDNEYVLKYSPILPAKKCWPQWWKDLGREDYEFAKGHAAPNMRSCSGIINTFNHGFMIPLWTDIAITTTEGGGYQYVSSDARTDIELHDNSQALGFYEDHLFLKINSPWVIQSEKDMYFSYNNPMWNYNYQPYLAPYGIMEFYYQHGSNIFMLTHRQDSSFMMGLHQPVVHFIPLTDRELVINQEVLSARDMKRFDPPSISTSFTKKYKNQRRILEGRCPIKTLFK